MSSCHVAILGSTGSIGTSTFEVLEGLEEQGHDVRVAALSAHRSISKLVEQVKRWKPALVVIADESLTEELRKALDGFEPMPEIAGGAEGVLRVATHAEAEIIVNAMVGGSGLLPTVRALEAGKRVALANKEALVVGGSLVTDLARQPAANGIPRLMPVDSEHSALFQALGHHPEREVAQLILTASGGPFRETPPEEFASITPERALRHPTWTMGRKITIDSATLMNKGLEVIEAHWLFNIPVDRIGVVVHPQSIVHSMVEFVDGNFLAHISVPDMRLPIQYALTYPDRQALAVGKRLKIEELEDLQFLPPDEERFPSIGLCRDAVTTGGTLPAVLNTANEVAVDAFLGGNVSFPGITHTVRQVMEMHTPSPDPDLGDLLEACDWAEKTARQVIPALAQESS
ncbi:1-deoxy-D-xylulose-5-phosphate reductoisomerase [Candidatus Zixiibacteriota bacterium]